MYMTMIMAMGMHRYASATHMLIINTIIAGYNNLYIRQYEYIRL